MSTCKRTREGCELEAQRAARLAQVRQDAPSKLGVFRAAYAGRSLRAAINACCLECVGFDIQAVRDCTAPACPLFTVRPYQRKRCRRATSS